MVQRLLFLLLLLTLSAHAAPLADDVAAKLSRVEEFKFIRAQAERMGIKAYLFGGSAAGFASYVKWDREREKPGSPFEPSHFDYRFSKIYAPNKDFDIVVSGSAEQAAQLQDALEKEFPLRIGSTEKSAWEVRPLSEQHGTKEKLEGNEDFLRQHSDSLSNGLIELTGDGPGNARIRDLRLPSTADGTAGFLADIEAGRVRYLFSADHGKTARALAGLNPPILEVIRLFVKASEFGLEIPAEDLARARAVIRDFDPAKVSDPYVHQWIEMNGRKLATNALDLDRTWKLLDSVGLRAKLQKFGDANAEGSLAYWMSKKPLAELPLGTGAGATAAELGIREVAHETRTLDAYLQMSHSPLGLANVFESRQHVDGEVAAGEKALGGDGFYTAVGKKGAYGNGPTLRFTVDPRARLGTDFEIPYRQHQDAITDGDYVLFKNRAAVRLQPESLKFTDEDFLRFLANPDEHSFDHGFLEKIRRENRLGRPYPIRPETEAMIRGLVRAEWTKQKPSLYFLGEIAKYYSAKFIEPDELWRYAERHVSGDARWDDFPKYEAENLVKRLAEDGALPIGRGDHYRVHGESPLRERLETLRAYLAPESSFSVREFFELLVGKREVPGFDLRNDRARLDSIFEIIKKRPLTPADRDAIFLLVQDSIRSDVGRTFSKVARFWLQLADTKKTPARAARIWNLIGDTNSLHAFIETIEKDPDWGGSRASLEVVGKILRDWAKKPRQVLAKNDEYLKLNYLQYPEARAVAAGATGFPSYGERLESAARGLRVAIAKSADDELRMNAATRLANLPGFEGEGLAAIEREMGKYTSGAEPIPAERTTWKKFTAPTPLERGVSSLLRLHDDVNFPGQRDALLRAVLTSESKQLRGDILRWAMSNELDEKWVPILLAFARPMPEELQLEDFRKSAVASLASFADRPEVEAVLKDFVEKRDASVGEAAARALARRIPDSPSLQRWAAGVFFPPVAHPYYEADIQSHLGRALLKSPASAETGARLLTQKYRERSPELQKKMESDYYPDALIRDLEALGRSEVRPETRAAFVATMGDVKFKEIAPFLRWPVEYAAPVLSPSALQYWVSQTKGTAAMKAVELLLHHDPANGPANEILRENLFGKYTNQQLDAAALLRKMRDRLPPLPQDLLDQAILPSSDGDSWKRYFAAQELLRRQPDHAVARRLMEDLARKAHSYDDGGRSWAEQTLASFGVRGEDFLPKLPASCGEGFTRLSH